MYQERIKKAQKLLKTYKVSSLLIEQGADLFYLTGQHFSAGSLVLTEKEATLFVDGRYFERAKVLRFLNVIEGSFKSFEGVLGFDSDTATCSRFMSLQKLGKVQPISSPILPLRQKKSKDELDKIEEAQRIGEAGVKYVVSLLKEGITEKQIAAKLEIFFREQGAEGASFNSIIAFGKNSAYPHYTPSDVTLCKGDVVLIDSGVQFEGYCSDMTRCFFFGEPTEEMKTVFQLVDLAKNRAIEAAKAGMTAGELDKIARDVIEKGGYGDKFTHGLGHGIGLQVHEAPYLRNRAPYDAMVLKEGMVVTVEPGIYLPQKFGIRLEDMILITKDGCRKLTKC